MRYRVTPGHLGGTVDLQAGAKAYRKAIIYFAGGDSSAQTQREEVFEGPV